MLELDLELGLPGRRVRVSLTASERVVGIAGPSGSGKTTLLRVIAGLDRRAVGTVKALGQLAGRVDLRPAWERRAGCPQDGVLFRTCPSRRTSPTRAGGLDAVVDLLAIRLRSSGGHRATCRAASASARRSGALLRRRGFSS
jgi:ABC-type molybdate transport system ATPase subunit